MKQAFMVQSKTHGIMNMFQGDLLADQPQQLQQGYLLVRQVQILADQLDSQRRYVVFAD
jgi:hypothetical protein